MTKIEWTDVTWNPVTGCTKVSQGCKHCYAERVSKRFGWDFEKVTFHPERLEQPLHWRKPRRVFVNSMSDLFHEDVPFKFISQIFAAMALTPRHTYQILTKRPERMVEWFETFNHTTRTPGEVLGDFTFEAFGEEADCWVANYLNGYSMPKEIPHDGNPCDGTVQRWPLPNVWLGVSVEDQATADERIPELLQTPAAVRFVSYEPALGPVDFEQVPLPDAYLREVGVTGCLQPLTAKHTEPDDYRYWQRKACKLDWVICGGESGPNARPMHPDWARSVRDQCVAAGVPFFFKQWGEWAPCYTDGGWDHKPGEDLLFHYFDGGPKVWRVGKKRAGRLLDGEEWNEYPGGNHD